MAAAASKIENARIRMAAHESFDLIEIGPAAMNGAGDIGRRARRVMIRDEIVLSPVHGVAPD
jgi:hypothetical protein